MRSSWKALAAAAALSMGLAACGTSSSEPDITPPSAGQASLQHVTIPGDESGLGDLPADVWLPPQYFSHPDQKFPLVYMYHGDPGKSTDWFGGNQAGVPALAQAKAGRPAVFIAPTVSPAASPGTNTDTECVNGPSGNWFTYISQDVPSWAKENLRIIGDAKHTAAAGLSMGGTCAQLFALKSPNELLAFGNISGTTAATATVGTSALFGTTNPQVTNQYNSKWIIANQPASNKVASWLATGSGDSLALKADQASYASLARQKGMTVTQTTLVGGHGGATWAEGGAAWIPWVLPRISK